MGEVVAGTVNSAPSPSSPTRGPGGKAGTRQPRGEHDLFIGLSDQLPMPTMDSSEKALEMWIKEYYKTDQLKPGVYNLLNKTRISCGKILLIFLENVEAYS